MQSIHYTITPAEPRAHRFHVRLTAELPAEASGQLRLFLPTWIPGSYVVRDFARHLLSITARRDGQALALTPLDRQSWQCPAAPGTLEVDCEFHARDESVRAAYLDDLRGFFNPTSLCLRIEGMEHARCDLRLEMPAGYGSWQVVTTLPGQALADNGFGDYSADSYWTLIDHPVAMGRAVRRVDFQVAGVAHAFVLLGAVNDVDTHRLAEDLAVVCDTQASVFGELPVAEYLFMALVVGQGYGGIEHRDCSVLQVAREALPRPHDRERSKAYEELLGLCSHEYFHLWNVKRIRPAAVAASDLTGEAHFFDLWAYEGVTSYYDDLALVRAGVLPVDTYLARLARLATRIGRTPGERRQSLAQSSFDAWLKFYRPDENTPNAVVSYYGKGALLALALDLKLRFDTEGRVSLDEVMQAVWQRHGDSDTPVPDGGLEQIAAEVSGVDLSGFFDRYLRSTAPVPWVDFMPAFGISAVRQPGADDDALVLGRLGVVLETNGCLPRVRHVHDNGPAQCSGVAAGDRVVACNGLDPGRDVAGHLRRLAPGAVVRLHLFRDDALLVRDVTTGDAAAPEWTLVVDDEADAEARARREAWLGG